ncbi:MAG: transposase zinc-binding domain-containing protein [Gemmatimonadetes bacterium]|nr:transposase zinc-binding domain-containing protein [Gemmatimonadota bacterium]
MPTTATRPLRTPRAHANPRPPVPTRPASEAGSGPVYRPRNPTATPLYPIVQHHLETFLARAAEADPLGDGVPFWVENDFRAYLRCGLLAHGFARARCDGCGIERLVALACYNSLSLGDPSAALGGGSRGRQDREPVRLRRRGRLLLAGAGAVAGPEQRAGAGADTRCRTPRYGTVRTVSSGPRYTSISEPTIRLVRVTAPSWMSSNVHT